MVLNIFFCSLTKNVKQLIKYLYIQKTFKNVYIATRFKSFKDNVALRFSKINFPKTNQSVSERNVS